MILYNLVVRMYSWLIHLAAFSSEKAKLWVNGRKNWRTLLSRKISALHSEKRIWMHCASYGEFEQGRPLLEAIRKKQPNHKLILSFFSPSGYEAFKNWPGADVICCLPIDLKKNAHDFLNIVKPNTVIFIKYEFWLHYLFQIRRNKIPSYLVSAVFKKHHPFFKWYGSIFRRSLRSFTEIFVQDEASGDLLKGIGIHNFTVSGDTRFDRVMEIKQSFEAIPFFETFCVQKNIIMGGSTWPKDDELLIGAFKKINRQNLRLILVPHNVDTKSISDLKKLLEEQQLSYVLYSEGGATSAAQVLVVDAMGLLSRLYHYATVAYIGGGFNSGIHNCLEPAVYFTPIVFYGGDDYHKYNEALDLIALNAAKNITNALELESAILHYLDDSSDTQKIRSELELYFKNNTGTSQKVLERLQRSGT